MSVRTPELSTVGVRDVNNQTRDAGGMAKFIKNMAKTDRELHDKLVDLMRFFNLIDVDIRLVSQLKACFISKEQGPLAQVPLAAYKDTMKSIFKHFRQLDEIIAKICDCTEVEIEKEGVKQKMADSGKVSTMVEFMKCFPLLGRKDKNSSQATNFVMSAA